MGNATDIRAPLVVELGSGATIDAALVGGKALGLERLMEASLPCPPAFCVTTAALERYLHDAGLLGRLRQLLEDAPDEEALRELRAIAFEAELPPELDEALTAATERMGAGTLLAVRSSSGDEDGEAHSFAGLHETQLGIRPQGVGAAVRKCWSSLWTEAALAYRRDKGLPLGEASMAVVVQALVPAHASAVVFTANPLTGSRSELLVHATCGLGPTLVDNEITPDTAVLAKDGLVVTGLEVGDKHLRVDARAAGGLVRSHAEQPEPALSEEELRDLAALAVEVERQLGTPVDVEAALNGGWRLIQARPITTLHEAAVL